MTPGVLTSERKQRSRELYSMRVKRGYTKSMLSRKSGLDRHTIDNIESGEKQWNIDSEIIYIQALK